MEHGRVVGAVLSGPRTGAVAVTIGGKVMFAGGPIGSAASDMIDIFDSATGTPSTATLPYASADPIGVVSGNKALFVLDPDAEEIAVYDGGADFLDGRFVVGLPIRHGCDIGRG